MAYYSFYRIFKDIIKTIFGRKVWRFLLIVFIIFIIFFIWGEKTQVFGAVVYDDIIFNNTTYNLEFPDWFNYDDYSVYFYYSWYQAGSSNSCSVNFCITEKNSSYTLNSNNYITCTNAIASYGASGSISDFPNYLTNIKNLTKQNKYTYNGYAYGVDLSRYGSNFSTYNFFNTLPIYKNNQIIFPADEVIKYPEVSTPVSDLQNLDFQVLSIDAWDFSNTDLYLLFYNRSYSNENSFDNLYPVNQFLLNSFSSYYMSDLTSDPDTNKIYWIPADQLNTTFEARRYLWL